MKLIDRLQALVVAKITAWGFSLSAGALVRRQARLLTPPQCWLHRKSTDC
jgi:hypothetical protein